MITASPEIVNVSIAFPEYIGLSTVRPSEIDTISWIIGIFLLAASLAPISLPLGDAEIRIFPSQTEFNAALQDPPSKISKQSPTTEITFSTPFISDASDAAFPLGQITMDFEPTLDAAPIN